MKILKADLEKVTVSSRDYPVSGYPEIAFSGRSNVGKSSLLNTLVNRKSLARVSGTPGKTRTINFFNVNDAIYLVDLPGYGYAKVSKGEKEKWGQMIEEYLNYREELKAVVLLVDIRHEPTADDKLMSEYIRSKGLKLIVVATKSDKLSKNNVAKNLGVIGNKLKLSKNDLLIPFSSLNSEGSLKLWSELELLCFPPEN